MALTKMRWRKIHGEDADENLANDDETWWLKGRLKSRGEEEEGEEKEGEEQEEEEEEEVLQEGGDCEVWMDASGNKRKEKRFFSCPIFCAIHGIYC